MRCMSITALTLLATLSLSSLSHAMFMPPDIEKVPVERLTANLQAKLADDPKNVDLLFSLARIHSMAYAQKTPSVPVQKEKNTLWLGYVPKGIPFTVSPAENDEARAQAKAHLKKAIDRYRKVVELKPDHSLARLGLAWCLQQAGKKEEAIRRYRKLVKDTLPADRKIRSRYHGLPTISTEATRYLVDLLDPEKDAEEIAKLKEQAKTTEKNIPRMITPVAVALRRSLPAEAFVDRNAAVSFDLDGSGIQRQWQWLTPEAAWLVYDKGDSGQISSALQMFGNVTFWMFWEDGYAAMAALDDNADGRLRGRELRHLALWHDRNQNGVSDPGEVKPLADHGIVELDCTAPTDPATMPYKANGATFADGSTQPTCDVILNAVNDPLPQQPPRH